MTAPLRGIGQLDHRNIVRLLGLCRHSTDGIVRVFIVQEWCQMNLRMFLQSGNFSDREKLAKDWQRGVHEAKKPEVEPTGDALVVHTYAAHAAREIACGMR